MTIEKTLRTNGYRIRSWGDIAALVAIMSPTLLMLWAVIQWGLKVESEVNVERARLDAVVAAMAKLETEIAEELRRIRSSVEIGILPIAEERLKYLSERIERHEQQEHNREP